VIPPAAVCGYICGFIAAVCATVSKALWLGVLLARKEFTAVTVSSTNAAFLKQRARYANSEMQHYNLGLIFVLSCNVLHDNRVYQISLSH
jgi:hypothetical protein